MAIKSAAKAIGESKQRKMCTASKQKSRAARAKSERARLRLRKKLGDFNIIYWR